MRQNSNLKYTFVLDTCESEPLLELGYRYDETGLHRSNTGTAASHNEQAQLVVVSAAKRGENAGTITVGGPESAPIDHGCLTYYLLRRLSKPCLFHPSAPSLV
ncbi:hypothetical protein FRC01_001107, partial [Tulasnella sp. 417]